MSPEIVITLIESLPSISLLYRVMTTTIVNAMATNIKGRYDLSKRLRKNASRADPPVMLIATTEKNCRNRSKTGPRSSGFILTMLNFTSIKSYPKK